MEAILADAGRVTEQEAVGRLLQQHGRPRAEPELAINQLFSYHEMDRMLMGQLSINEPTINQ